MIWGSTWPHLMPQKVMPPSMSPARETEASDSAAEIRNKSRCTFAEGSNNGTDSMRAVCMLLGQ